MKSDIFILIPCHVDKSYYHIETTSTNLKEKDQYAQEYISSLRGIAMSELVDRVYNSFDRYYLGEYESPILGDAPKGREAIDTVRIKFFLTACERTKLSVLTGVICNFEGNPTNVLDQITREEILVDLDDRFTYLDDFLLRNFKIIKNGEAKTCLIQNKKANYEDILYYMATETNDSNLYNTKIISKKYHDLAVDNVAVYDFSDIFVSESVIYQVLHDEGEDKIQYEGLLIFIVEILVMKLSAIYRSNNQVTEALEKNKGISVKNYEILSNEFANTLSIWQVNIYRYKGAQTIADKIQERFDIDNVLKNYKQNDEFLQNIIDTRNVKNSITESKILFVVAILLFLKDFYAIVKNIYLFFYESQEFSASDVVSSLTSVAIILVVVFVYLSKNFRIKGRRK